MKWSFSYGCGEALGARRLQKPRRIINIETGAEQPADREGEMKGSSLNSLPSWEQAEGSGAHL